MGEQSLSLLGVVLAGGKSSRMGQDKALLKPWGKSGPAMLTHAMELLTALTGRCVVSCGADQFYPPYTCIKDPEGIKCPAQGILACLKEAEKSGLDGALVTGCDQPALTKDLLALLLAAHSTAPAGTMATLFKNAITGRFEMLVAIYTVAFIGPLAKGLGSGQRSLFQMLPKQKIVCIPYGPELQTFFMNCNTPDDYRNFASAQVQAGSDFQ